ncbi:hypothetical protein [Limibacillus halophilus]|jgi:hypothetical protein
MPGTRQILFGGKREVRCTVTVVNRFESLEARVDLAERLDLRPGDSIRVLGEPIVVPYGEAAVFERRADVRFAPAIKRLFARFAGSLQPLELLEVSFSSGRKL